MRWNSSQAALLIIEDGVLVAGNRVAVSSSLLKAPAPALLSAHPGSPSEERTIVRLVPADALAEDHVAISAVLADELGLERDGSLPWSLSADPAGRRTATELSLELAVEQPLEQVVERLNRSEELGDVAFALDAAQGLSSAMVEVDGLSFRITRVEPAPRPGDILFEISEDTRVQVFAPGAKSGVDMVILADCSGSMETADLTDTHEQGASGGLLGRLMGSGPPSLRRDEAQRRALRRLLDLRLGLSGRVSRIALVGFNDRCAQRFPRGGGMQEMDDSASSALVQEFRDAIGLLQAENAGTDIGQALHFAAELLYRHGHPANDRLIVLVSDGANWAPKGDDATGEETIALKEPISLTAHLHRDLKINLHAIGIGTKDRFMEWFRAQPGNRGREPHIGFIPNHDLLEELVRVGGGDPSRTGDADVLESYFSGLGVGVTRRLRPARRRDAPPPSKAEVTAFSRRSDSSQAAGLKACHDRIDALIQEILDLYQACNEYSARERDRPAFRMTHKTFKSLSKDIRKKVSNPSEFIVFILATHQTFYEARDIDGKAGADGTIEGWLNDDRLRDLNAVRICYAHDLSLDKKTSNLRRAGDAVRRLVGVAHVEDNDVLKWAALQEGILSDIRDVLTGLRDMYRDPGRLPPPKPRPPAGFIWKS